MHLAAVLSSQWSREHGEGTAGLTLLGLGGGGGRGRGPRLDFCQGKATSWCLLTLVVGLAVFSIGLFEATRLTTHVLRAPCTVVGTEIVDVGTCTLCEYGEAPLCEAHPVATARIAVNFKPAHSDENITGWVWYCKGRAEMDPCQRRSHADQLGVLTTEQPLTEQPEHPVGERGPVPCTVGEVFSYMQMHAVEGDQRQCYYSTRDTAGTDVWFAMPAPGLVDHVWFEKHIEYPVLLALGGLVLMSLLLSCLALEGAELWASGLTG